MTAEQWNALRDGDVIRAKRSGTLRPVLQKSNKSIVLPIIRESWTTRPFTFYTRTDCILGFEVTGWRLSSRAIKRIRGQLLKFECIDRGFCDPARKAPVTQFDPIMQPWDTERPDDIPSDMLALGHASAAALNCEQEVAA